MLGLGLCAFYILHKYNQPTFKLSLKYSLINNEICVLLYTGLAVSASLYVGLIYVRNNIAICEERKKQEDATIGCLLSTSVSTCFGHYYVHLQENKDLRYCIWCSALVLLDVVGSGCGAQRPTAATISSRCTVTET